jgi:Tfp pilus assembly protein FimT
MALEQGEVQPNLGTRQAKRLSARSGGWSLLEMVAVVGIAFTVASITFIALQPAIKTQHVANGYETALSAIRRAREESVAEMRIFVVTFDNTVQPNTITVTQNAPGGTLWYTATLPQDVFFDNEPGIPNTVATTPDGFGTGAFALDFAQGFAPASLRNQIYFYPDGSAHDAAGNLNNGVLYVARTGELMSSRAISLWGATGRMRGWRLYGSVGNYVWRQQ